ncbi:MAG: AAA family ATPase [Bdellovibrionales bacterium]|nr:AAA family ATPase [Bdellovibrionales bacterium]
MNQESAVKARAAELAQVTAKKLELATPFQQWLLCATSAERGSILSLLETQVAIDHAKAEFLSLPEDDRLGLVEIYEQNLSKSTSLAQLSAQAQAVDKRREEALVRFETAEATASSDESPETKKIAGDLAVAQKYLVDLEESQLKFIEYKVAQSKKYGDISDELSRLAASGPNQGSDPKHTLSGYRRAAEIWRDLVDHVFDLYASHDFLSVPQPPNISLAVEAEAAPQVQELAQAMNSITQSLAAVERDRVRYAREEKELISELLLKAGAVRSRLFNQCRANQCTDLFTVSSPVIRDVVREIKIVPFKGFALAISKTVETKRKLALGFRGWIDLLKQAIFLVALLLLPFVFFRGLRWIERQVDIFRRNLINRSMLDYRRRTSIALWIVRLNPFLPWIGMVILSHVAENILAKTDISELTEAVVYVRFYLWYRIAVLILRSAFTAIFSETRSESFQEVAEKVRRSSFRFARVVLIEAIVVHATANAVREAYVYTAVSFLIRYLNIFLIFVFCSEWKREIRDAARATPFSRLKTLAGKAEGGIASVLLSPILLLVVLLFHLFKILWGFLSALDFVKWINSEFFKKRLQKLGSVEKSSTPLPAEYIKFFDFRSGWPCGDFIETRLSSEAEIRRSIDEWNSGQSEEDAIILHGNRGFGKSTLVKHITEHLSEVAFRTLAVPAKTTTRETFWSFLGDGVGTSLRSSADFLNFDKSLSRKMVIFLDDAQNLFLSKIGSFDAYRELQNIVNLQTSNVFWCIVMNSRSWNYLKGVFGREHFYGRDLEARPWTDVEIQSLILSRQKRSGYGMRFDDKIKAYSEGAEQGLALGSQAEVQFFRLLWGQSRGNPRSALVYWLTALDYHSSERTILVGVPRFLSSGLTIGLSDDALFILAAISKHENLDFIELRMVTGISESVIKRGLKRMEDAELIWRDEAQRFRVSPRAQYFVDFYLLGKNFLHE